MDLSLPGEGGLASLRRLRNAYPDVRFLVLTMHDAPSFVRSALAEGASAYLCVAGSCRFPVTEPAALDCSLGKAVTELRSRVRPANQR